MNEDKLNQSILTKAHLLLAQMIIVFGLVITGGCQSAGSVEEANSIAELQAHMDRYAGLFNAANAEAIAKEIYAAPIMVVNPDVGEHTVYETEADVRGFWAGTFSAIKSKGWVRSVVHDTQFQMAGPDMAIAKISFSRLRANGDPILPARRIANHFYLKTAKGWRMILASSQAEADRQAPSGTANELRKLMGRYIDYLNGDNPAADVSNKIWQTPRLSRSFLGDRKHSAKLSKENAYERLDAYLKRLKAEGLDRFVVEDLKVHLVSKNLAFVDLYSERLRKDSTAIPPGRTGFTYIWMKKPTGWRMIGTLAHGE